MRGRFELGRNDYFISPLWADEEKEVSRSYQSGHLKEIPMKRNSPGLTYFWASTLAVLVFLLLVSIGLSSGLAAKQLFNHRENA
jgi:hypothetical protein